MLELYHSAAHRLVAPQPKSYCCWLAAAIVVTACVGCRTAQYSAAKLPKEFLVPPAQSADEINLANLSGLGSAGSLIGPGDLVEVTVASGGSKEKVEPMLARVSQNGNVNVPLIGDVHVAGMEPFEAGERIAAAAVERGIFRQPSVVLDVTEPAVNRVTVIGAVNKPGLQKIPRNSSDVLSAVAAAGGFTKVASTKVEVMRQRSTSFMAAEDDGVVTASYDDSGTATIPSAAEAALPTEAATEIARKNSAETSNSPTYRLDLAQASPRRKSEFRVGDGDVVMVLPEKERVIHVSGLVNLPNQFKIPRNQDVHVLDAIAMAGGIKSPVADKVFVIRRVKGMPEPAVIQVSIAKAKQDGRENLRLASGDLVSVETTPLTQTVDTLTTFFRISAGIGSNFTPF